MNLLRDAPNKAVPPGRWDWAMDFIAFAVTVVCVIRLKRHDRGITRNYGCAVSLPGYGTLTQRKPNAEVPVPGA